MPRRAVGPFRQWVIGHRGDLVGVSTLLGVAALFVSPALKDGGSFGGFDLDTTLTSLGAGLYSVIHNHTNSDAVSQMVSWNALDWRLVRSGHFPLWNDYSGLGMPQFLNFESSTLSLPDLVSYAFPLRLAFLVVVYVKFVIAGTGAYAWCRVVRLRVTAATFAGLSFMLAGAFSSWVTWPLSDVVAWTGWICAFAILCYHAPARLRYVIGLGIVVGFSVYGGFPEANVMVALVLVVVLAGVGLACLVQSKRLSLAGLVRVAAGTVFGVMLSAPLWFPGLQVIAGSHRETEAKYVGLPVRSLPLLFSSTYFGLPFTGRPGFELQSFNYYESVSYVGLVALVLCVVALASTPRRPLVVGLVVALAFCLVATYQPVAFHPFESIVWAIRPLDMVRFERMRVLSALIVAMLAAVGLDRLLEAPVSRSVKRGYLVGLGGAAVVVGVIALNNVVAHLPPGIASRHLRGLIWPAVLLGLLGLGGLALFGPGGARYDVRHRVIGTSVGLVCAQGAFLFFSGVGIASYSHAFYPETPAEVRLVSIVGSNLLGMDNGDPHDLRDFGPRVGIFPEVNIGYGLRVFAIHDPVTPYAYFTSWPLPVKSAAQGVSLFVPDVDSASLARRYGISYIIAKPGLAPPAGTVRVAILAGETLYRVPDAARFSFAPGAVKARVTSVAGSATTSFTLRTLSSSSARLVLRVTAVPGWHATLDGRTTALQKYEGVMESMLVPSGSHVVRLWYLPGRLVVATYGAVASVFGVLCTGVVLAVRRRAGRPAGGGPGGGEG